MHPTLTDQTIELLAQMWTVLRHEDLSDRSATNNRVLPITIRSYETLIRLSTAHAKLRLAKTIAIRDCIEGFRLMAYCLFGDSHALDDKIREILSTMEVDEPLGDLKANRPRRERQPASNRKARGREMEEEVAASLTQKMSKIDIHKEDEEAERVIQQSLVPVVKEMKSKVYKALTVLTNRSRGDKGISIRELAESPQCEGMDEPTIRRVVESLANDSKIHFDEKSGKVYM